MHKKTSKLESSVCIKLNYLKNIIRRLRLVMKMFQKSLITKKNHLKKFREELLIVVIFHTMRVLFKYIVDHNRAQEIK